MSSPSAGKRRMDTDVLKLYPWNSFLFLLLAICISVFVLLLLLFLLIPTSFPPCLSLSLLFPPSFHPLPLPTSVPTLLFSFFLSLSLYRTCLQSCTREACTWVANARTYAVCMCMLPRDRLFIRYEQFIGRRETTRCNVNGVSRERRWGIFNSSFRRWRDTAVFNQLTLHVPTYYVCAQLYLVRLTHDKCALYGCRGFKG